MIYDPNLKKDIEEIKRALGIEKDYSDPSGLPFLNTSTLSLGRERKIKPLDEKLAEKDAQFSSDIKDHVSKESNNIMISLTSPLSKFEGILLFVGGLFGNVLVNGISMQEWRNSFTYSGSVGIVVIFLLWYNLNKKR